MSAWPDARILELFNIDVPIVLGPMAGAAGVDLAIAVARAGGLGSLPCAMLNAEQIRTNVLSTIQVTQAVLPHVPARGGRIVNVSSSLVYRPRAGLSVYAASKAAVGALTHSFAVELGPRNITVNAVAPAMTRTDMTAPIAEEVKARMRESTPLGRLAEPEDIADAVAFLASDDARWITGRTLKTDGGFI